LAISRYFPALPIENMTFSENRFPLFRIMLERQAKTRPGPLACEATHRIKDATGRRKQDGHRPIRRIGFKPLISP
jgi:hypothetical protein